MVVTSNQRKTPFDRQNKIRWCRAIQFQHFPKENMIYKNDRIPIPTTGVFGKFPKSEANLPSDGKVDFSRNLENELGKCQGH